jgi:hypothetical protein
MSIKQLAITAAALLLAAILLRLSSAVRGVLFVVLLGSGIIAMIGLGLNHVGQALN